MFVFLFGFKGCQLLLFSFRFRFEHVPLVTPNGDLLVNDLSFEVKILKLLMDFDRLLTALVLSLLQPGFH